MSAASQHERLAEAMAGERERAQAARREQVAGGQSQRPVKRFVRPRVVGRVARLAGTLLVGEP
jgi:hypothetical protein